MTALGQEHQFSRRRLSGHSWFSQQTFAETQGNGQEAPKADVEGSWQGL